MNPTRYNLALSRAKDAYNKKVRQNKMSYDEEKGRIKDHNRSSTERLKKNHNNEVNEIVDSYDSHGARGSYPGDWQAGMGGGYMIRPLSRFETKFESLNC